MKLDNLLKLTIAELKNLPVTEFSDLTLEEKKILIDTKEQEGSKEFILGIKVPSQEEQQDLNDIIDAICPELKTERELAAASSFIPKRKRKKTATFDTEKLEAAGLIGNPLYEYELEQLSPKKRSKLLDFDMLPLLTQGFNSKDLLEIFSSNDEIRYIFESSSSYYPEGALRDALEAIASRNPKIFNSTNVCGRVFIITISPEFKDPKWLIENAKKIILEYVTDHDNTLDIAIAEDSGLYGTTDLEVAMYIY